MPTSRLAPVLSIIVCAYNPREDYLRRTLEGLKNQTLTRDQWECILVDNHSEHPLAQRFDLSWHPRGRVVREEELGLTPARLRGSREAVGDVLIFVDDDNVLSSDYLSHVRDISLAYPLLGAWGGCIRAEFEESPAPHLRDFLGALAIREFSEDIWSNFTTSTEPCGAGMCVRKSVVTRYAEIIAESPIRRSLDRCGLNLASAGDTDIAQTSYEVGLGTGLFARLQLLHLIPRNRVQPQYLYRLLENISYSTRILQLAKGVGKLPVTPMKLPWKRRLWNRLKNRIERPYTPDLTTTFGYWWGKGVERADDDWRKSIASKGRPTAMAE